MKKLGNRGIVMVMGFLLACILGVSPVKAQGNVSIQVFYDELQPYGTWIHHNQHGYVWMPRVERGFMPYATNGYWITTEYGNTWVSDYSWGWAPFHYGRWFYDDFYGWMWVPDTTWGPAWVAWRGGGGYYGWAPLMPGFSVGVSYNYYNRIPHSYWSFVPYRYITYRSVYRHCVPRPHVVNIINHTTIVTNNYTDNRRRTYFTGPSRREIERTTHERVRTYSVNDQNRPGRTAVERDRVSFYKPEVDDSNAARLNAMPSRYMRDNGSGKLEPVEARRDRTSESYKERSPENELPKKQDQRNLERNQTNAPSRNLEQMERQQQRDMQRENETFERFKRERENPARETERNRAQEMRSDDPLNENRSLQQRENNIREEQLRPNNGDVRRQQFEKQNETLQEQRNLKQREDNLREEQRRSNNSDVRRQQFEKQNEMQEQRNLQRQRDNAVIEQQRNNENVRRQQYERPNSQREFNSPNERRAQERQPQSLQRMERPAQERFNRSNSNPERQRSGSQQEIRRSTFDQKGGTPSKSQGGSNAPRRHN